MRGLRVLAFWFLYVAVVVFMAGTLSYHGATYLDRQNLAEAKAQCDYDEHAIETLMWEVYRKGEAPLGSVLYFVGTLRSANMQAVPCLKENLPERWGH
jgi:hypothetical protein